MKQFIVAMMMCIVTVIAGCGDDDEKELNAGKAALEIQDYATAFRLLKPLAQDGHAEAQYWVGYMYDWGLGLDEEGAAIYYEESAIQWYRRAAEQGHADAQYNLGYKYKYGDTVVEEDPVEAEKWLRRAAKQGHEWAHKEYRKQNSNGMTAYDNQDYATAFKLLKPLADDNDLGPWGYATQYVGEMYLHGNGVSQDLAVAEKYLRRAEKLWRGSAEKGNAGFQYELAEMYAKNQILEDSVEAEKWYRMAAEQGHAGAQRELDKHFGK